MGKRNQNPLYNDPRLASGFDHLSDYFGMSGNRDSRHLGNLSSLEQARGRAMDNREKQGQWDTLQKALEGLDPFEALGLYKATGSGDLWKGKETQKLLKGKLDRSDLLTDQERHKTNTLGKIAKLEDFLLNTKQHDPRTFNTGDAWLKERALKEQKGTDEAIGQAARNLLLFDGIQPSTTFDPTGSRGAGLDKLKASESKSEILKDQSVVDYNKTRIKVAKNIGEAKVVKIEKETEIALDKLGLAKTLNWKRVEEIKERILALHAIKGAGLLKSEQQIKLIEQQLLTEAERTQVQKQIKKKEKAKASQEEKKLKALPDELKEKLIKLKKQNEELDAKIAKLEAGEKSQMASTALYLARRSKVHNDQEIAKILLPLKKKNLEDTNRKINADISSILTKRPSPSQISVGNAYKEAQVNKLKNSGAYGPYDPSAGAVGNNTPTTPQKAPPPDPKIKSVFNGLLNIPKEQLLGWGEADINEYVKRMTEKYPEYRPELWARLLNTAKRRYE